MVNREFLDICFLMKIQYICINLLKIKGKIMFEKRLNIILVCPKGFNNSPIILDENDNAFIHCKVRESYIPISKKENCKNDKNCDNEYHYFREESDNSKYCYDDYSPCEKEFYMYVPIEDISIEQVEILTLRILRNDINLKGINKNYFLDRKVYKEAEKGDTTTHRMVRFRIENYLLEVEKAKMKKSNVEMKKCENKDYIRDNEQKNHNLTYNEIDKNFRETKKQEVGFDYEDEDNCCLIY